MTLSIDPLSESLGVEIVEVDVTREEGLTDELAKRTHSLRQSIPNTLPSNDSLKRSVSTDFEDVSVERAAASAGIRPSGEEVPEEVNELDALKKDLAKDLKDLDRVQKQLESKAEEETRLGNPVRGNYLYQISKLVAEISTMLNSWNNRDSHKSEKTKKEYRKNSDVIAEANITKAKIFGIGGVIAFVIPVLAALSGVGPDANSLSTLFESMKTGLANFYEPSKEGQVNSLILQEIQKLGESSGSNNDLAEKARRILDEVKQWLEKAIARG